MCCLKNEQETYEYLLRRMPGVGDIVQAQTGEQGKVQNVNVLRQSCRVIIEVDEDNKELREFPVDELEIVAKKQKGRNNNQKNNGKNSGNGMMQGDDPFAAEDGERKGSDPHVSAAEDGEQSHSGEKKRRRRNRGRRRGGHRDGQKAGGQENTGGASE